MQDTTPPAITVPANKTVNATSAAGAAVTFSASATDLVDGPLLASCSPASGSTFPLGTTSVTCQATDAHDNTGSTSFTITVQPVVPNAPTGVSAISGNASATVSFTAPAFNGGSPISSYTVTCGTFSAGGVSSPITVSGLANGTSYTCTVTASNAVGTGAASVPSGPVVPATVPGAPTVTSVAIANSQATVSFNPPVFNGGAAITSYAVTPYGPAATASVPANALSTDSGVSVPAGHSVLISATGTWSVGTPSGSFNANGDTTDATESCVRVTSAHMGTLIGSLNGGATWFAVGVGPTIVSGPGELLLSSNDCPPASNFNDNSGSLSVSIAVSGSPTSGAASPITVTGLTGGQTYAFTATATNGVGSGPASTPSAYVIPTQATTTTVSGPAAGTKNTAIAASSISATLAGGTASPAPSGTITFTLFGPQAIPPTTCTSGGTTIGTATVSGSGTYYPAAGFTPSIAGTYWWYASYGGDTLNGASNSGCGAGMASTAVQGLVWGVTATVTVGSSPYAAAANPTTNTIYVPNVGDNSVSVINGLTNSVTATVPVGSLPVAVAVNPSTNTIYVVNQGDNTMSVINGATNTVTATVPAGNEPNGVAVNSTTNTVYVADVGNNSVSVISGTTNSVTATVTVTNAYALALNPTTNKVYVAQYGSNSVTVINGATNTVAATVAVGVGPVGVDVDTSANKIYVANQTGNTVSVINGATNTVTATVGTGKQPAGVAVNPTTHTVFVSNTSGNSVTVINGTTNTVTATLTVSNPNGVGVNTTTGIAYVALGGGTVAVLNLE